MATKKKAAKQLGDLNANTVNEWAQAAIEKYNQRGKIVDAMLWGRIVAIYEEKIEAARLGASK